MTLSVKSRILIGAMRRLGLWSGHPAELSTDAVAHARSVPASALPDDFDGACYLALNPDVDAVGADPAEHYYYHGRHEGRLYAPPSAAATVADAAATEAAAAAVRLAELPADFSGAVYLQLQPDLARAGGESTDAVARARSVPASALPDDFDGACYLALNPDVDAVGADPAEHYYYHGRHEGRLYAPPSAATTVADAAATEAAAAAVRLAELPADFSGAVYLQLHPDLARAGVDPADHFLAFGRHEGRPYRLPQAADRSAELPPGFDAALYLELNPDLGRAGSDPVEHYLSHGRSEGRRFAPVETPAADPSAAAAAAEAAAAALAARLPPGFDGALYRRLHPDLSDPAVDPAAHYLSHGQQEGRIYSFPAMELVGSDGWDAQRATVMVVSHEASRTGAPVLSLNLVQVLRRRYNVIAVLLGGGALYDAFVDSGAIVVNVPGARANGVLAEYLVDQLSQRYPLKFALVNSIESRVMLAPLAAAFVPVLSLVHEFASYTRPRDAFRSALLWSGEVVFSANVTMENAFAEYPDLGPRGAHILPQGRCLLPASGADPEAVAREQARLRRLIRPPHARDAVVVLGAGFVQLRKGIELFLECAARVVRAPGGEHCRFIWIGKGYDPDHDIQYSVYLADQIRRAGLQQHVLFIDETSAIETAYEEADLLLLSSRLDPLPNVAIDALFSGVPVLCFDQTTGIADFLSDSGLRAPCVADYLDTSALAARVLALARDAGLRESVAARSRAAAEAYFSMDNYVARLEALADGVAVRTAQERADTETILASGLFRPGFACAAARAAAPLAAQLRHYVRAWASGIDRRKPFPGFHPGVYRELHGVRGGADPLADYLRAGRPDGPWHYPLVTANVATVVPNAVPPAGLRVALHLHVYYPDLLPDIVTRLGYNGCRPDLFVSIADEAARPAVETALAGYAGRTVAIEVVPNRGRDIGPLLTGFGPRLMAGYDYIGHLHTKKSHDVKDAAMGATWYHFLLENLLGGAAGGTADAILSALDGDATLGMVFPGDPYVLGMGGNAAHAAPLLARLGLVAPPEHFMFPVGTMFWARTVALAPLMGLNLGWDDYPDEPLPYDGSMLHALERLFALTLPHSGLRMAATYVEGVSR
jgi:glycosyltransferase involved in cell wall biosynthesis